MEEDGGGGGFGYMNLPKNPYVYRATPPLTAIDRFLLGQNNFSYQNHLTPPTILKNKDDSSFNLSSNGLCDFSSSGGGGGAIGGVFWPRFCTSTSSDHGIGFLDDHDVEFEKWIKDLNSDSSAEVEEGVSIEENSRGKGKGKGKKIVKGGNSMALIKGQWTDEEDRKLVRLVKQFGVRKWAQIAEKMVGRAGKQCRERWHNHLRPDIKKETWSEEEERMLVEAHQIVGNKWAEIAKRIQGRTENSIKNLWNATKRRQNARRNKNGNKKFQKTYKYSQSSFLQDYIKSQTNFNDTNINYPPTTTNATANTATTTPATSAISNDPLVQLNLFFPELSQSTSDDSQSLMNNTYDDDELNFMQNLFGNNFYNSSEYHSSSSSSLSHHGSNFIGLNDNLPKEEPQKAHLYSDLYVSYLLDGNSTSNTTTTTISSNDYNFNGDMKMESKLNEEEGSSSSERKDMDLIEMVSASKFYSPYN